ncbi:hypothetical protein [Thalassobacillus hwangdonensis]
MTKAKKVPDIMKYRTIALICLFISIPINVINTGSWWLTIIGISLLAIFFIMTLTLWKCPACKTRLPLRFDKEKDVNDIYRCPYCDTKFIGGEIID